MRRLLLALVLAIGLPSFACAQLTTTIPAQTLSANQQPPVCDPSTGKALGWTGSAWTCTTVVTGSAVTISSPAGSGISVAGGPAYTISAKWPLTPVSGSTTLACTDASATYQWTAATAGTITIPASGGAGCMKDTMFCVKNSGTASVTLASSSTFSGGPITLNAPQDECVQADGAGKWIILGAATAIANPNPIQ